jgi:hypothetical protein
MSDHALECADLSALCYTATWRGHLIQKRRQVAALQGVAALGRWTLDIGHPIVSAEYESRLLLLLVLLSLLFVATRSERRMLA